MDTVGLDTVAFIEDNYIQERGLDGRKTVDWLRENYIKQGKLGLKSDKGGLYPPTTRKADKKAEEEIYMLDAGLGANVSDIKAVRTTGRVIKYNPETKAMDTLVSGQSLPDGIDISKQTGRIFWSNMGSSTSTNDGSIHSANLEIDSEDQVLYWTDRGEHPLGCCLYQVRVSGDTVKQEDMKILARHFHEPIGLKLDAKKYVIVADLGGGVYRVGNGKKTLMRDEATYTGVAIL